MLIVILRCLLLGLVLCPSALGQSLTSIQLATALGSLLASEKFCGLQYDQDAIQKFINSKVSEKDMNFPSTLQMMVMGSEAQNADMSPSAKTAHCTQIARIARSYGFIH